MQFFWPLTVSLRKIVLRIMFRLILFARPCIFKTFVLFLLHGCVCVILELIWTNDNEFKTLSVKVLKALHFVTFRNLFFNHIM